MAQRRMFSKDITEHDAFLEMPLSSQALYFHLGMQADDDGFVSPNRIMRMIGGQTDDLRILIGKKYVLQFDDGVVVIKHWKLNNYLRTDRYKITAHKDKLSELSVKNNGSYTWYTTGIPLVDAGKDRIGKVTSEPNGSAANDLSNNKKDMWNTTSDDFADEVAIDLDGDGEMEEKKPQTRKYPNAPSVRKVFQEVLGKSPAAWKQNKNQLLACENLYTERGLDKVKSALLFYKEHQQEEYCPKIHSPHCLDSKWTKLGEYKLSL